MTNETDRVWDLIGRARAVMLTTRFSGGLRSRPLEPRPDRAAGAIYFVTDERGLKDDEIAAHPRVALVVIDRKEGAYLSLSGTATIARDPTKAAAIWRSTDDVWWPDGPDDPNVLVLRFQPDLAELWDGPASGATAALEIVKARLSGARPNLGENRKVTVTMS